MIKEILLLKKKEYECIEKTKYIYWELVRPLDIFLENYQDEFKNSKSIEALKRISSYVEKLKNDLKSLEDERFNSHIQAIKQCKHEIIIECTDKEYYSKLFCPICGEDYSISKDNSIYVFECSKKNLAKCKRRFSDFLNENIDNDNLLDDLEDYLEDFENEGIILRRVVYEKKRTN